MTQPSRKPLDRILGNNVESVAVSDDSRNMYFQTKEEFTTWLQLLNNYLPRVCSHNVTNNEANSYVLTGTGSDTLIPPISGTGAGPHNGYKQISGFSLSTDSSGGFTSDGTSITVPVDGTYMGDGWLTFRHSSNGATVALVFGIEYPTEPGVYYFSQRPTGQASPNNGKLNLINGGGILSVPAGTKISVWAATDVSGTVTAPNATLRLWWMAPKV